MMSGCENISVRKPGDDRGSVSGICPLCGQPRLRQWRPFCSARCRDVDLFRWLNGAYAIAGVQTDYEDSDEDSDYEDTAAED